MMRGRLFVCKLEPQHFRRQISTFPLQACRPYDTQISAVSHSTRQAIFPFSFIQATAGPAIILPVLIGGVCRDRIKLLTAAEG